jgi:hypothetical protein
MNFVFFLISGIDKISRHRIVGGYIGFFFGIVLGGSLLDIALSWVLEIR